MSLWSVKFEVISPLTALPNSQTIFGTICTYYAMQYGDSELEKLLNRMEKKEYPFIVSSMFYENMLPCPLNFEMKGLKVESKEDTQLLKSIKKVKYFSKEVFKFYKKNQNLFNTYLLFNHIRENEFVIVNNCLTTKDEYELFKFKIVEEMRIRVNVNEEQYYNDLLIHLPKGTKLEFYIEINDEELKDKILSLLESMKYISFGGSKSVGYNMFSFSSITEENNLKSQKPALLISLATGNSLIDYENSFYQLVSINNRFTNTTEVVNRKNVIAFKEGSVISCNDTVIGEVIKEENENGITYQNFVGLLI